MMIDMAISETTFADRLQRARQLQTTVAGFMPAFAPIDASLAATPFGTFIDDLDTLNTTTGTLVSQYSTEVPLREDMVKLIKRLAAQVLSLVKSNPVWKNHVPAIKSLADKIRGVRPKAPKPVPPPPGETPAAAKRRNSGEQGFGDIEENFERLIAALGGITGYTPPAPEITIANLTTTANAYAAKNLSMATLFAQLTTSQRDRADGFGQLRDKMKAIKQAIRGQYGPGSPEADQVGPILL
jgi:hypothetical protein